MRENITYQENGWTPGIAPGTGEADTLEIRKTANEIKATLIIFYFYLFLEWLVGK